MALPRAAPSGFRSPIRSAMVQRLRNPPLPPQSAPPRRRTGLLKREPGAKECGDTFAREITIEQSGARKKLKPVVELDDFGKSWSPPRNANGLPYVSQRSLAVGWGGPKEERLRRKLERKLEKLTIRLQEGTRTLEPEKTLQISELILDAWAELDDVDAIHEKWKSRFGGPWPLGWSDTPTTYPAARWPGWGGDPPMGAGGNCSFDETEARSSASPSLRVHDRPFGAASVVAKDARVQAGYDDPGPSPVPGARFGYLYTGPPSLEEYASPDREWAAWQVRCPERIETNQRQPDREAIWHHYLDAARTIRCAQWLYWSARLYAEARGPSRASPSAPKPALPPAASGFAA